MAVCAGLKQWGAQNEEHPELMMNSVPTANVNAEFQ